MADQKELEFTYSLIDRIFRLSLGEMADFSGAKYDGDFSLTLEEAQRRKHDYIAEQIGIEPGRRVLDLGCGWGPLLNYVRSRGATGLGVTLSSAQAEACRRNGLDVHVQDARTVGSDSFGPFDAVASLGAFEHFCSVESYEAGRQDQVYRDLFSHWATVLPSGGRLYLQTMVFGRNMIPIEEVSIDAPRDSDGWIMALMGRQFPGSWSALRVRTGDRQRRARLPARLARERALGLHRDDQAVAQAVRRGVVPEDAAQGAAGAEVADQPRLPAGLHVGREREQHLLRAGAARPLPARLREGLVTTSRVIDSAALRWHGGLLFSERRRETRT